MTVRPHFHVAGHEIRQLAAAPLADTSAPRPLALGVSAPVDPAARDRLMDLRDELRFEPEEEM